MGKRGPKPDASRRVRARDRDADPALIARRDRLIHKYRKQGKTLKQVQRALRQRREFLSIPTSIDKIRSVVGSEKRPMSKAEQIALKRIQTRQFKQYFDEGLIPQEIASKMNVTLNRVRKLARDSGVSLRKRSCDAVSRRDIPNVDKELRQWYVVEELRVVDIREKLLQRGNRRSVGWISRRLQHLGIAKRKAELNRIIAKKANHKKITLDPSVLRKVIELYEAGYGFPHIKKHLLIPYAYSTLQRIVSEQGIRLRTRTETVHTSPLIPTVDLGDDEIKLVREYEMGETLQGVADHYAIGVTAARRILKQHNVDVRTREETLRIRDRRKRDMKLGEQLRVARFSVQTHEEAVRDTMRKLYRTIHYAKFKRQHVEDVVDSSMSYADLIAAKYEQDRGSGFVFYVANYAMLRYFDTIRPPRGMRRGQDAVVLSLDAELPGDGKRDRLHDVVEDPYAQDPACTAAMEWVETKDRLYSEVRKRIDAKQLPRIALDILKEYYVPMAEGRDPKMQDVAHRYGCTAAYVSEVATSDDFKYMIAWVLGRKAA